MDYQKELKKLIDKNSGIIMSEDLKEYNIPRQYLSRFLKEDKLKKVERGVYTTPETFNDEMYILQQKNKRIIFSHETSLFLHDLVDRDPLNYTVTVPYGYNASHLKERGVEVHTVKKEFYSIGVIEKETNFGRMIKVYNKERTICDILKNRNNMDPSLLNTAIRNYLTGKGKNIPKLLDYSKKLRIKTILRRYLEMFL